ncbi:MAG TPA: SDR family NAD(P)-dependent oxidoreductase [Dehalococcoidia bacterium]|nr:SDR family NAD(P)-dependent oxidoreductase [Dehalococcoidia bacterium]
MQLDGKVAVVTGANQGIGQGVAEAFAREGAKVVMAARRAKELDAAAAAIRSAGGEASVVPADISLESDVLSLVQGAVDLYGTLDVIVNNAGVTGPIGPIWELDVADFQQCLDVNLTGMWLCCREAVKVMKEKQSGKIINIGSITGKRPAATRTAYCASKMGVVGLTRSLALEVGEFNINVNCISPGGVKGPRLALLAEQMKITLDEIYALASEGAALHRVTENDDIAAMCVFLASDLGHNISGQDINIDAGTVMF